MGSDIVFKDVNFSYAKQRVLEGLTFELSREDFMAIIGPNGGGKTTLLKLMLGLLAPENGEIHIYGKDARQKSASLAYVPQDTNINSHFPITALEVVLMGCLDARWFSFYDKSNYKAAYDALERVGMSEYAKSHINELSGGQRQRVFIARALCAKAKFLLLDEPTASVDTQGQIKIYELLKELNNDRGIVIISHDVNIALAYANKVLHVNKNIYIHEAPTDEQKEILLESFKQTNGHICPVDIVAKNICTHKEL